MKQKFPPRKDSKAFTLIELLVVIAIISLLISILLPSLTAARDLAKQTICLASMRQQATALITYSAENDLYIPFATGGDMDTNRTLNVPPWYMYFRDQEGYDAKLFLCPTANDGDRVYNDDKTWYVPTTPSNAEKWYGTNYGGNYKIMQRNDKYAKAKEWSIIPMKQPAKVFAVAEAYTEALGYWPPSNGVTFRHGREKTVINLNFWDGHAESWNENEAIAQGLITKSYGVPWYEPN